MRLCRDVLLMRLCSVSQTPSGVPGYVFKTAETRFFPGGVRVGALTHLTPQSKLQKPKDGRGAAYQPEGRVPLTRAAPGCS